MAVCVLYKNTGIGFRSINPSIRQHPSNAVNGSSVIWKKPVPSASGRWLDPIRPGAFALHVGKDSGGGVVTGNGDVKVPVFVGESQE